MYCWLNFHLEISQCEIVPIALIWNVENVTDQCVILLLSQFLLFNISNDSIWQSLRRHIVFEYSVWEKDWAGYRIKKSFYPYIVPPHIMQWAARLIWYVSLAYPMLYSFFCNTLVFPIHYTTAVLFSFFRFNQNRDRERNVRKKWINFQLTHSTLKSVLNNIKSL